VIAAFGIYSGHGRLTLFLKGHQFDKIKTSEFYYDD
jgi:hypothetical protein